MVSDKIKGKSGKPGQNYRKLVVMEELLYDFFQMQYLLLNSYGRLTCQAFGNTTHEFGLDGHPAAHPQETVLEQFPSRMLIQRRSVQQNHFWSS